MFLFPLLPSALAVAPLTRPPSLSDRVFSPRLADPAVAQRTRVVRVPQFLSDDDIAEIHAAAAVVRQTAPDAFRTRSNGLAEGSWKTVFFNDKLLSLLPHLHERLVSACRQADAVQQWNLLLEAERMPLSFRCAEYHTVETSGGLPIEKHYDYGSLITMDLMLSDTSEFEGGAFETLEADGTFKTHKFERGDLMLFQSHKYHCVRPVTAGTRQVMVCELWEGLPRTCPCRCDIPWGPCYCRLDADGIYLNSRENGFVDFASLPFRAGDPMFVKMGWSAMQPRPKLPGEASSRKFFPS